MPDRSEYERVIEVNSLKHGQCHGFKLRSGAIDGFVINWHGQFYAYRNRCPHTGVNLNWQPDIFLDLQGCYVQCSMHGALFEPNTGLCIRGPCLGASLQPLTIVHDGSTLYVDTESLRDQD